MSLSFRGHIFSKLSGGGPGGLISLWWVSWEADMDGLRNLSTALSGELETGSVPEPFFCRLKQCRHSRNTYLSRNR